MVERRPSGVLPKEVATKILVQLYKQLQSGNYQSMSNTKPETTDQEQPLHGLRILDISTLIAGPVASTRLADFGAEVLKVELPGVGDALRKLAPHKNGSPLWWKVTNRNKRRITLDLRQPEGQEILRKLIP